MDVLCYKFHRPTQVVQVYLQQFWAQFTLKMRAAAENAKSTKIFYRSRFKVI